MTMQVWFEMQSSPPWMRTGWVDGLETWFALVESIFYFILYYSLPCSCKHLILEVRVPHQRWSSLSWGSSRAKGSSQLNSEQYIHIRNVCVCVWTGVSYERRCPYYVFSVTTDIWMVSFFLSSERTNPQTTLLCTGRRVHTNTIYF